jgi:hypothetical protein
MKNKWIMPVLTAAAFMVGASSSQAYTVVGGDAANQASADAIVDIVIAFDTSGSMSDDIDAIQSAVNNVIANLNCADIDVWVRARLTGITESRYGLGENVRQTIINGGGSYTSNSSEDNGPVVSDIINNSSLFFTDDSTASQSYYKAIVTVGDEGTQNGAPVDAADWAAALQANQDAIASGTLLFSWLGKPFPNGTASDPEAGNPLVGPLFQAMAEGGTNPYGTDLLPTGGIFVEQFTTGAASSIELAIEDIICTTATGGVNTPDGGSSLLMLGGVLGLFSLARKRK